MRFQDLLLNGKALFSDDERKADVEHLMTWLLAMPRASFLAHLDEEASESFINDYNLALDKLKSDVPIQYIMGFSYFNGEQFKVSEATLIPRFDTEVLYEFAKNLVSAKKAEKVLDLCTGSGILAISLSKIGAEVYASDISSEALAIAGENAELHETKVTFREGNLFEPWEGMHFDLIVSNPPYIDEFGMKELDSRVLKEPHLALYGGKDGLDFYRLIIAEAKAYLSDKGIIAFEIGYNQGLAVRRLLEENGYQDITVLKDYQGLDRVVVGYLK